MTKKEFLEITNLIPVRTYSGERISQINKKLIEEYDFGCKFQNNKCIITNEYKKSCCENCAKAKGYFYRKIPDNWIGTLAKLYSKKTGFWRKDKGCILPSHIRSEVCIKYRCQELIKIKRSEKECFIFEYLNYSWACLRNNKSLHFYETYFDVILDEICKESKEKK